MAINYNDMLKKINYLPKFEQEKIKTMIDELYEDYADQKLYPELDRIKKEMADGEYYTLDQIDI